MNSLLPHLFEARLHLVLVEKTFDLTGGVHVDVAVVIQRNKGNGLLVVDTFSCESMFDGFDGLLIISHSAMKKTIEAHTSFRRTTG